MYRNKYVRIHAGIHIAERERERNIYIYIYIEIESLVGSFCLCGPLGP